MNTIVVHELAHLKEREHNKAFYRLYLHSLKDYHQLELDMRLYLIQLELGGSLLWIEVKSGDSPLSTTSVRYQLKPS